MAQAPTDLAALYDAGVSERDEYLEAANDVAKITLHHLKPKGEKIEKADQPYSHEGGSAVRSLASTLFRTMMPPGVQWGGLDFPPEVWDAFRKVEAQGGFAESPDVVNRLRSRLVQRSKDIINRLQQKLSRSRGAKALRRNIVEGSTLMVDYSFGLRVFPLRSFVVSRVAGHVKTIILKEEIAPDAVDRDRNADADTKHRYTLVERQIPTGPSGELSGEPAVWVQGPDATSPTLNENLHPDQFFVIVPEVPEIEAYPFGYAYDFLRLFHKANHAERNLGQALAAAGYNRPIIREGSSTATRIREFMAGESGKPWVGNPEDFGWLQSTTKMNDWSFIVALLERISGDIAVAFAKGLKDRPFAAEASATAVLAIVDELDTQVQDLHTALEESFQRPLFMAEARLMEAVDPLINEEFMSVVPPEIQSLLQVQIVTGVSVLARQQTLLKFASQFLPFIVQLDPQRLRVNGGPIVKAFADSMPFPTEDFYTWDEVPPLPPQPTGGPGPEGDQPDRTETIMTPGGPQPPQPERPAPPSP